MAIDKECWSCQFYEQGNNCSFCSNPKQTDSNKKEYCYYYFSCEFYELGSHPSRIKYMNDKNFKGR